MSESEIYRRLILTSKVDPHTERVKIMLMITAPLQNKYYVISIFPRKAGHF